MKYLVTILLLVCLSSVNSRKCFTCNGVGKTEEENSFGNFFDLSHREEAQTAERDESTIDVDLCNNIKSALPERMLQDCPNADDVCFVEKVYGRLEAAIEMSDGEEDMQSFLISFRKVDFYFHFLFVFQILRFQCRSN